MTLLPRFINKTGGGADSHTAGAWRGSFSQHNGLEAQAASQVNQSLLRRLSYLPPLPPSLPASLSTFHGLGEKRNVGGWAPRRALHISAMPGSLKRREPRGLGSVTKTSPRPQELTLSQGTSITQEGLLPPQGRVSTLGLACHSSFSGLTSSRGSGSAKLQHLGHPSSVQVKSEDTWDRQSLRRKTAAARDT